MEKQIENYSLEQKIKYRGKINLIVFDAFPKEYDIKSNEVFDIMIFKKDNEIINIYENNIENDKYFNVVVLNYDNKEDALIFLQLFIEKVKEDEIIRNYSDYPFFVFFKKNDFNKEILYSYYLEKIKEDKIGPYYDLKSHNIYFIKNKKEDIEKLINNDIINYFYEYQSHIIDCNPNKISILFMGPTGSGKSTFINYMLGKQRAYSSSVNYLKSRGGEYIHSKYPISIIDTEGLELLSTDYQLKSIYKKISNEIIQEGKNNKIQIIFYLNPGPFNVNRDLDYLTIESLIKFEEYNILYYLIMTKDPEESSYYKDTSLRYLNRIIKTKKFDKLKTDLNEDQLIYCLERIKNKLEDRIFSVDVSKRESKTIDSLLNRVYEDLKIKKLYIEKLVKEYNEKRIIYIKLDYSEFSFIENGLSDIPFYIKNIFPIGKIDFDSIDVTRKNEALKVIEETKNVSGIKQLFFFFNKNNAEEKRKNMIQRILSIYDCKRLTIELIENKLLSKEKSEWFSKDEYTEDLGHKIINICEDEKKIEKYIINCGPFIGVIDEFGKYVNEFLNFRLNGQRIPYDCELNI